ncbi:MAG: hypothetical protein U7126_09820 [Microcoleus sp.]
MTIFNIAEGSSATDSLHGCNGCNGCNGGQSEGRKPFDTSAYFDTTTAFTRSRSGARSRSRRVEGQCDASRSGTKK